jgi:hypothetical protein
MHSRRTSMTAVSQELFLSIGTQAPAQMSAPVGCVPEQTGTVQIVNAIAAAETDIRVQAYTLTSASILGALAAARRRGVDVQVVLDKTNDQSMDDARYSSIVFMANAGVPVWIGLHSDTEHKALFIIDQHIAIERSVKSPMPARASSASAQAQNAESITLIDSLEVAVWFLSNWTARRNASALFEAPAQQANPAQTQGYDAHAAVVQEPECLLEAAD